MSINDRIVCMQSCSLTEYISRLSCVVGVVVIRNVKTVHTRTRASAFLSPVGSLQMNLAHLSISLTSNFKDYVYQQTAVMVFNHLEDSVSIRARCVALLDYAMWLAGVSADYEDKDADLPT
ncbi:hypothetical protein VTN00DRAFT_5906 [Thermoascus crustaceus]|uniref:uncharacterized protein n=1 Tax=Thermoascus crustaceus TaxID=5088 RepID=UPI00374303DA